MKYQEFLTTQIPVRTKLRWTEILMFLSPLSFEIMLLTYSKKRPLCHYFVRKLLLGLKKNGLACLEIHIFDTGLLCMMRLPYTRQFLANVESIKEWLLRTI